ncbi:glucose-6-phosphate isomerase [Leucobacter sp. CSA2]|uniref:Glucose-6-phosphate isomerase n=1 Tax=Leucobacter edaphi TaxID=2796472 RepID=A0A934QBX8_9MICO|nr:glucose-6-phosphate isomerase [Leucobacter edaphi]MBK0421348.1 glucose-6-phosphate isomerase [Leucobacter edaphi]
MTLTLAIDERLTADPRYAETLAELVDERVASRIFALDASLWGADAEAEAAARLGWTDFAAGADEAIGRVSGMRERFAEDGVDRIVLCGMGGSSLAPAVIARWAGVPLTVLDSTHPEVVARALADDLARTAVVISSKSGTTIETQSHRAAFERAFAEAGIDASRRVLVVTDPGSPLERAAADAGQAVCNADPDVGGRFSALTAFGLIPAGLAGADIAALVAEAQAVREALAQDSPDNPALRLAAAISCGLPGRYVLGITAADDANWGFGTWIEQLVAESTGKDGRGVLPISLPDRAPELSRHADTQLLIEIRDARATDVEEHEGIVVQAALGAQFLLWEVATAALGRIMGIDPFNQPDVESAKVAARAVLADPAGHPEPVGTPLAGVPGATLLATPAGVDSPASAAEIIAAIAEMIPEGGYLAIQAYLDPETPARDSLHELRDQLAEHLTVPVALGWGPRYLHSTGQLHKGGPALGAFLQLCDGSLGSLPIPGTGGSFETLIAAQARGDRAVLEERGRPVLALSLTEPAGVLRQLAEAAARHTA